VLLLPCCVEKEQVVSEATAQRIAFAELRQLYSKIPLAPSRFFVSSNSTATIWAAMFILDDERIARIAKMLGLAEWQVRRATKRMVEAGLLRDLGADLFEMPKFDPEKLA
jgi:hypothetical protein